MLVAFLLG